MQAEVAKRELDRQGTADAVAYLEDVRRRADVRKNPKAFEFRACLTNARLLRPPQLGIFLRSFPLHRVRYAPKTIAESCSIWVALATAIITQTGS